MASVLSSDQSPDAARLRRMTEYDLAAVMAIELRAYEFAWTEINFRDCMRSGYYCRVLEAQGQILGYAVMSAGAGEAHILNLCIHLESRGRGHGRLLLTEVIDHARRLGADMLFLEVRPSNDAARWLYEKLGFNEVGVRKNYYPTRAGREDALILARQL